MNLYIKKYFTETNWVIFIMILFCIRYIPLETRAGASMIKTGVSLICLFLLIIKFQYVSKSLFLTLTYYVVVLICVSFHPQTFRWSTMLYLLSFLTVYTIYYNAIVCRQLIDYNLFVTILKRLIYAYTIVLLLQQILLIAGIHEYPLLNLTQFLNRGIGANSLSGEPSVTARIMAVLYLALIRMEEIKYNRSIKIEDMWQDFRWPTIGFLWTMFTMGSATAMIGIGLLSFYFMNVRYLITCLTLCIAFIIIAPHIEFTPVQRVYSIGKAMFTGDKKTVFKADDSGASRIIPIMNLFQLDIADRDTWFGKGIDYSEQTSNKHVERVYNRVLGNINEYGLISYFFLLLLVYTCMIYRFFSLETLFFIFLFAGTLGNVAYGWGAIMIFTAVRYFQKRENIGLGSELINKK